MLSSFLDITFHFSNNIMADMLAWFIMLFPIVIWFFIAHLIAKKIENEQTKIILLIIINPLFAIYYVSKNKFH